MNTYDGRQLMQMECQAKIAAQAAHAKLQGARVELENCDLGDEHARSAAVEKYKISRQLYDTARDTLQVLETAKLRIERASALETQVRAMEATARITGRTAGQFDAGRVAAAAASMRVAQYTARANENVSRRMMQSDAGRGAQDNRALDDEINNIIKRAQDERAAKAPELPSAPIGRAAGAGAEHAQPGTVAERTGLGVLDDLYT